MGRAAEQPGGEAKFTHLTPTSPNRLRGSLLLWLHVAIAMQAPGPWQAQSCY